MKKARSSYPMSVDERDQIEASWMNSATAKRMIPTLPTTDALQGREVGRRTSCTSKRSFASNDLTKAKAIFAAEKTPFRLYSSGVGWRCSTKRFAPPL